MHPFCRGIFILKRPNPSAGSTLLQGLISLRTLHDNYAGVAKFLALLRCTSLVSTNIHCYHTSNLLSYTVGVCFFWIETLCLKSTDSIGLRVEMILNLASYLAAILTPLVPIMMMPDRRRRSRSPRRVPDEQPPAVPRDQEHHKCAHCEGRIPIEAG